MPSKVACMDLFVFAFISVLFVGNTNAGFTFQHDGFNITMFNESLITWEEAKSACRDRVGGTLVNIQSSALQTNIDDILRVWDENNVLSVFEGRTSNAGYWVGGSAVINCTKLCVRPYLWENGDIVPQSGNGEMGFKNWYYSQPNVGSSGSGCIYIRGHKTFGKWIDNRCYQKKHFICQALCTPNPCRNGGTCSSLNGIPKCTCIRMFTGDICDQRAFELPPMSTSSCMYHIEDNSAHNNYNEAKTLCEGSGSVLAMVKNFTHQEDIGKLARNVYGMSNDIYLWVGGKKLKQPNAWEWLDGSSIPTARSGSYPDQYPRWGQNKPGSKTNEDHVMLSTLANLSPVQGNPNKIFYWTNVDKSTTAGFACEKLAPGLPCGTSPCKNGGVCSVNGLGCSAQYSCRCARLFYGDNCEKFPPKLLHSSPSTRKNVFRNRFTLVCNISGNPTPNITWRITNSKLFPGVSHIISGGRGSPFTVENTVSGYTAQSKLTMNAGGLCLDKIPITCSATNSESEPLRTTFIINRSPLYKVIKQTYFVFSSFVKVTEDEAEHNCMNFYGGHLASVADAKIQAALGKASNARITSSTNTWTTGAWIGLKMHENGSRLWPNKQMPTYTNWAAREPKPDLFCTYMSHDSSWAWKTEKCSTARSSSGRTAHYICEVQNDGVPEIISLEAPPCDGENSTKITVRWRPSSNMVGFLHRVSISDTSAMLQTQDTIPTEDQDVNGILRNDFINLKAKAKHTIRIFVSPDYCSKPIVTSQAIRTGYVRPIQVPSAAINLTQNNTCRVVWDFPSSGILTVGNFIINVTKLPNLASTRSYDAVSNSLLQENFFKNVTSKRRSILFPALPNRRNVVKVYSQSCAGNASVTLASGECVAPPAAPPSLPTPDLSSMSSTNQQLSLRLNSVDERNGPISCYFVIGQYHETKVKVESKVPSKPLLDKVASTDYNTIAAGQEYLAVATKSDQGADVGIIVGDGRNSSCDITAFGSRKKRNPSNKTVYYATNVQLIEGKFYSFYVISTTPIGNGHVGYSVSGMSSHMLIPANSGSSSWVIAVICASMLGIIGMLIILGFRYYRRRRKFESPVVIPITSFTKHESSVQLTTEDLDESANEFNQEYENLRRETPIKATSIPLQDLKATYLSMMLPDNHVLRDQFAAIGDASAALSYTNDIGKIEEHRKFNRYRNIVPFDNTRVILDNDHENKTENGYINASYIDSYDRPQFFIATQGPLECTVSHFWAMIWQKKCPVIVMLTRLVENQKTKCVKYWPEPDSCLETGNFRIIGEETSRYGRHIMRKFKVFQKRNTNVQPLTVTQHQYTGWPDHGVPSTTTGLLQFYKVVMTCYGHRQSDPIVVHCSAGVGRTGTLIAIDYLMREMKCCQSIDVYSSVMNMRRQRCHMVQTQDQYKFIHKVMAEVYSFEETDFVASELHDRQDESNLLKEFQNLDVIGPLKSSCAFGNRQMYVAMNRTSTNVPYDNSRVLLHQTVDDLTTPYVNASYIEEYASCGKMIATQAPMSNTVNEFWRTVLDCGVKIIVMLTPLQEGNEEKCYCYWPSSTQSSEKFGRITVSLVDVEEGRTYTLRTMDVTKGNATVRVTQFHYDNWLDDSAPPDGEGLVTLLNDVSSLRNETMDCSLMVHCSDGLGRTGVFCALSNMVERLKAEQKIDVFRTVKDLRDMRPGMVPSLEFYTLCYKALNDCVALPVYANFTG